MILPGAGSIYLAFPFPTADCRAHHNQIICHASPSIAAVNGPGGALTSRAYGLALGVVSATMERVAIPAVLWKLM